MKELCFEVDHKISHAVGFWVFRAHLKGFAFVKLASACSDLVFALALEVIQFLGGSLYVGLKLFNVSEFVLNFGFSASKGFTDKSGLVNSESLFIVCKFLFQISDVPSICLSFLALN